MDAQILIQQRGPNGNATATVEDDGRSVYLCLEGDEGTRIGRRAVWVCNRVAAPGRDEPAAAGVDLRLMPRAHCRHPSGAGPLDPAAASLVWLPEGDGVGLYDADGLRAALVPWSGRNGFPGYARDAIGRGPWAWDLGEADALRRRFADAQAYWAEWDRPDGPEHPWTRLQEGELRAYETNLGPQSRYLAADGGRWPPRAIVCTERREGVFLTTAGLALRPQPAVEMATERPEGLRRIELGLALPWGCDEMTSRRWMEYLAGQSGLPWARYTWLGPGHTVPCNVSAGAGFPAVVLISASGSDRPCPLPDAWGDPVSLLWMVPVSPAEIEALRGGGAPPQLSLPRPLKVGGGAGRP
jgi:hypothetical protein